jgi:hypothetical protein
MKASGAGAATGGTQPDPRPGKRGNRAVAGADDGARGLGNPRRDRDQGKANGASARADDRTRGRAAEAKKTRVKSTPDVNGNEAQGTSKPVARVKGQSLRETGNLKPTTVAGGKATGKAIVEVGDTPSAGKRSSEDSPPRNARSTPSPEAPLNPVTIPDATIGDGDTTRSGKQARKSK